MRWLATVVVLSGCVLYETTPFDLPADAAQPEPDAAVEPTPETDAAQPEPDAAVEPTPETDAAQPEPDAAVEPEEDASTPETVVWSEHLTTSSSRPNQVVDFQSFLQLRFTSNFGCDLDLGKSAAFSDGFSGRAEQILNEAERNCLGHGADASVTALFYGKTGGTSFGVPRPVTRPPAVAVGAVLRRDVASFQLSDGAFAVDETWSIVTP